MGCRQIQRNQDKWGMGVKECRLRFQEFSCLIWVFLGLWNVLICSIGIIENFNYNCPPTYLSICCLANSTSVQPGVSQVKLQEPSHASVNLSRRHCGSKESDLWGSLAFFRRSLYLTQMHVGYFQFWTWFLHLVIHSDLLNSTLNKRPSAGGQGWWSMLNSGVQQSPGPLCPPPVSSPVSPSVSHSVAML